MGAAAGGVAWGALGWLVANRTPGHNWTRAIFCRRANLAALSGATSAELVGPAGGLIGMGMPEYEARQYEGKVKQSNISCPCMLNIPATYPAPKGNLSRCSRGKHFVCRRSYCAAQTIVEAIKEQGLSGTSALE